jgi:Ser/Thr protein kinase RdoA (MazF antagonist)
MYPHTQLAALCRRWSASGAVSIVPLGATGFSGSRLFVVELPDRPERFVLKSFHAAASREHAAFVHDLVRHVRGECSTPLADVIVSIDGDTIVTDAEGRLWELSRFMPGVAVPCPTPAQAAAAATALARLHLAAASLPGSPARRDASPGIERRITQAGQLLSRPWLARREAWSRTAHERMSAEMHAALDARVAAAIEVFTQCGGGAFLSGVRAMRPAACMLQPVLRDVWCDHLLFAGPRSDNLTAIVDLHAAGIDTPATDLARLMGSWDSTASCTQVSFVNRALGCRSLLERWPEAIAAYDRVRPLSHAEADLIPFLHATGVVCGLDNWFRWTLDEHREFPDARSMLGRIDRLLTELPAALATAWTAAGNAD